MFLYLLHDVANIELSHEFSLECSEVGLAELSPERLKVCVAASRDLQVLCNVRGGVTDLRQSSHGSLTQ